MRMIQSRRIPRVCTPWPRLVPTQPVTGLRSAADVPVNAVELVTRLFAQPAALATLPVLLGAGR